MKFWQTLLQNPSGKKSMDDFAASIDKIQKLIFSSTLTDTGWDSAKLADRPLDEKVLELKQQSGNDISYWKQKFNRSTFKLQTH